MEANLFCKHLNIQTFFPDQSRPVQTRPIQTSPNESLPFRSPPPPFPNSIQCSPIQNLNLKSKSRFTFKWKSRSKYICNCQCIPMLVCVDELPGINSVSKDRLSPLNCRSLGYFSQKRKQKPDENSVKGSRKCS